MHVQFKTNLGSRDAEKLGLDFKLCLMGMDCKVSEEIGEKLIAKNLVLKIEEKTIQAVPEKPAIADAEAPAIAGSGNEPESPAPSTAKPHKFKK